MILFKIQYLLAVVFLVMYGCKSNDSVSAPSKKTAGQVSHVVASIPDTFDLTPIEKSKAQWKSELSAQEYYVLREAGTERSFTGDLWDNKAEGIYTCRGCGLPLFESNAKYVSGTGWPSFYQPINSKHVAEDTDYKIGYARTEVHCARCGGHLGHVFPDGPEPTGLRYCMNSVSMDFVPVRQKK